MSRRRLVTAEREERIHAMLSCCMVWCANAAYVSDVFCHFYSQFQFFRPMVHHLSFDMVHLNHNRTAIVYTKRISTRFYHNSSLLMLLTAFGGVSFSRDSCRIIDLKTKSSSMSGQNGIPFIHLSSVFDKYCINNFIQVLCRIRGMRGMESNGMKFECIIVFHLDFTWSEFILWRK